MLLLLQNYSRNQTEDLLSVLLLKRLNELTIFKSDEKFHTQESNNLRHICSFIIAPILKFIPFRQYFIARTTIVYIA